MILQCLSWHSWLPQIIPKKIGLIGAGMIDHYYHFDYNRNIPVEFFAHGNKSSPLIFTSEAVLTI